MEKSSDAITMAEMILLENKSSNSLQVISFVSFLAILIWVITFQEHISCFLSYIQKRFGLYKTQLISRTPISARTEQGLHSPVLSRGEVESVMAESGFSCFLSYIQKRFGLYKTQLISRPPISARTEQGFHSPVLSRGEVESVMAESGFSCFLSYIQKRFGLYKTQLISRPPISARTEQGFHSPVLSRGEVESVMAEFGFPCDRETAGLFEDEEVREEEVREAFDVFDEDGDGFIDEKELRTVMWRLGFKGFSEEECLEMIRVFDGNDDGRIDVHEFGKLLLVR